MRFLVTGASGLLGGYLVRELLARNYSVVAWSGSRAGEVFGVPLVPVDLGDDDAVARAFRLARPDVLLHAGALARVADCHKNPTRAEAINTAGSRTLAALAGEAGARLVLISTDLVFDGAKGRYREQDEARPVSVYGRTKLEAETPVLAAPRGVVARASLLFGPTLTDRPAFFDDQVRSLREGRPVTLFRDEWRTPLALTTAARALVELARSDLTGLVHVGGPEHLSRLEMGARLAAFFGADPALLISKGREDVPGPEPRPRDMSLDSSLWRGHFPKQPWPNLEDALREMTFPPAVREGG